MILKPYFPYLEIKSFAEIWGSKDSIESRNKDIGHINALNAYKGGIHLLHKSIFYLNDRDNFEYSWVSFWAPYAKFIENWNNWNVHKYQVHPSFSLVNIYILNNVGEIYLKFGDIFVYTNFFYTKIFAFFYTNFFSICT